MSVFRRVEKSPPPCALCSSTAAPAAQRDGSASSLCRPCLALALDILDEECPRDAAGVRAGLEPRAIAGLACSQCQQSLCRKLFGGSDDVNVCDACLDAGCEALGVKAGESEIGPIAEEIESLVRQVEEVTREIEIDRIREKP